MRAQRIRYTGGMTIDEAMTCALALARQAADDGDVPVGAVVLDPDGRVIGRGRNRREMHGDPLAHAEVLAMWEAARQSPAGDGRLREDDAAPQQTNARSYGDDIPSHGDDAQPCGAIVPPYADGNRPRRSWNLSDCTLVVTLEPCPMCAGACLQTHVGRIVFGAWDAKLGACGSVWDIPRDPHVGHSPEVIGGVREGECARLLADFFAERRS